MPEPEHYSHQRYLFAKQSVTERGLNRHVWNQFSRRLNHHAESRDVRLIDVGAGTGNMAVRIIDAIPYGNIEYTILDSSEEALEGAAQAISDLPYNVRQQTRHKWSLKNKNLSANLKLEEIDALEYLSTCSHDAHYNIVVLQSILDLLPVSAFLTKLKPLLENNTLIYIAETFNGLSTFLPNSEASDSDSIISAYHQSMHHKTPHGATPGPKAGRKVLDMIREAGGELQTVGSSDWAVLGTDGRYPGDEAYFLYHILHFIENELTGHPAIDPTQLDRWLSTRRAQIESGELIYLAHQLDALATFA